MKRRLVEDDEALHTALARSLRRLGGQRGVCLGDHIKLTHRKNGVSSMGGTPWRGLSLVASTVPIQRVN